MKPRILATILYFSAGVAILLLPSRMPYEAEAPAVFLVARLVSPVMFVLAAIALFYRPRFGHFMAFCAGLLALPWFIWTEISWPQIVNSWIALNMADKRDTNSIRFAELKIFAAGLTVTAAACSVVRLLPSRWTFRGSPFSNRTWPALAVCFLVFAAWFGSDVMPYRLPGMVTRGFPSDLEILHVEKRGLQFHEVAITVGHRREEFSIRENRRRLFQYRFGETGGQGTVPAAIASRVLALIQSPELQNLRTPRPKALRTWNAEGWYVFIPEKMTLLAFSSENGTQAPREVTDLFHEIEEGTLSWKSKEVSKKDVCLGFCYDPLSGLGATYANERCTTYADGTRCN
jgi:hypothetical protein